MKYLAFLYKDSQIGYKDNDNGYNIIIPDVDGAYSCGDDFEHTVEMGKEALELVLEEHETLPQANPLEYFTPQKLKELDIPSDAIPQLIEYSAPTKKRVTVNLHLWALNAIDEYMAKNGFKNRSAFLEESALLRLASN